MKQKTAILALYRDMETGEEGWCVYHGGHREASDEFILMREHKPKLREVGRFRVQGFSGTEECWELAGNQE